MRLWSIHPEYLDRMGLLGLWREAILAQRTLLGKDDKYARHSHMLRFYAIPVAESYRYMEEYLFNVWYEGKSRGYKLDLSLIEHSPSVPKAPVPIEFPVTSGQLALEYQILSMRVRKRDPEHYQWLRATFPRDHKWVPRPNPIFVTVHGKREDWDKFSLEKEIEHNNNSLTHP